MTERKSRPGVAIDVPLVRKLVDAQFPQWSGLDIVPVPQQGNDNRTFRLGPDMSVRLPSAGAYASGVEKEQRWLPTLAQHLPLAIPSPIAVGTPADFFPLPWSVYRWLDGEIVESTGITDMKTFARTLGDFLVALRSIDATDGPIAGRHSFYRGAPLDVYDAETRRSIEMLGDRIDREGASAVWDAALPSRWPGRPVWFHGDVAAGNLLVREGRLRAVIDFGTCGVGDPACDLVIAWTFLEGEAREVFRQTVALDDDTWARGRGWALWKALIVMAAGRRRINLADRNAERVVEAAIAEHRGYGSPPSRGHQLS
jgi:aminoglycoside phosphotransferase (APT) family kinase protein